MATLQELLDIEGVVAAGEFSLDGSLLDFEAKTDMFLRADSGQYATLK